jgi:small GTP-binding protein
MRILTDQKEALLKEERHILSDLRVTLTKFGATEEDQTTLVDSISQLDEFFLLVVVGEFNAGKSSFINALLGSKLLKEGVTPTTTQVNVIRFGSDETLNVQNDNLHVLTAPIDILADLSIVDTPGTNAIIRAHEQITTEFVPRSDLVLFVTSADRPFSESERSFLERIRDWGKKVVIVLNKADLLQSDEDLQEVLDFIEANARNLLGITPDIFPISARAALRAKQGDPKLWDTSRFEPLETYILNTLDQGSRLRLKYLNPLGVGEHLVNRYLGITNERLSLLAEDFTMLEDVDSQLNIYKEDMTRNFEFRMSDVEKILLEMENRGQEYFDETIRFARVVDLMNKDRIQREFEQRVVADVPQQIDSKVSEMIDWLVESDLRQWQAVTEYLADRRHQHKDRIVGDASVGTFHYDRERLIDGVGREAKRVVDTYDRTHEARSIADGVQNAVAATAILEVGAVGLGALVTAIATTVAVDVTGIVLASFVALVGVFIIPARKRQAKAEMRTKITEMREQLSRALRNQFNREIESSVLHINEAIAPYTRFVRAEQTKLNEAKTALAEMQDRLTNLKSRIEGM